MKYVYLLGLSFLASCSSFANFVYMKENEAHKTIIYQTVDGEERILSNTSEGVWAIYPDISTDGNEVIFAEGPSSDDLHLTYINRKKNLTQKFYLPQRGMLLHPKFSKSGRFIFYSAPDSNRKNTIFFFDRKKEVQRQGGDLRTFSLEKALILTKNEEAYFPRPSSDGNFVVYQRNNGNKKEIVLFDRIENKKKVLAQGMSPALSFDEKTIAFTSKKNGNWDIFLVDRFTGEVKQVTSDAKDEMSPTFMPDNTLVFSSNKSGPFRLYQFKNNQWLNLVESDQVNTEFYAPQFSGDQSYKQSHRKAFPGEPRSSFGTISHRGKIYMCGGHKGAEHTYPPESFSDQFFVYDIENNNWKELAPRPVKAHGYQLAAYGNYIYAFGGFSYSSVHKPKWKSLDRVDRYDIKKNTWEQVAHLNSPRSSNVAITIDDKVYLVGGWDSTPKSENDYEGTFLKTIDVFNLKTQKVEIAPFSMPLPLRRALTGVNHQGKILLIGGLGEGASHFELLNKVTLINPQTGESSELPALPFATFAPAAGIIKDELLVFGGMFKTGPMNYEYVSHIYSLDLTKKQWKHTGRFLDETKGFSQVFQMNETTLGILGGHHYSQGMDTPVSTFETFAHQ